MKAGARKKTVARKKTAAAKAAAAIRGKKKAEKEKQVDDEEEAEDEQRKAEDEEEEKTAEEQEGPLVISNIAILDPSCQDHVWECLEGNKKVACIVCSYKHDLGKRKGLLWYRNKKRPANAGHFCRKCSRPEFNFYFVACNRVREGESKTCQYIARSFNTL